MRTLFKLIKEYNQPILEIAVIVAIAWTCLAMLYTHFESQNKPTPINGSLNISYGSNVIVIQSTNYLLLHKQVLPVLQSIGSNNNSQVNIQPLENQ